MAEKVWQKRFSQPLDPRVHDLNRSLGFDNWLAPYDLQVSTVWARALNRCGLLSEKDLKAILQGLKDIGAEFEQGEFELHEADEDIHMAIERRLGELIGEPARRLHHGRSRNDQVATDLRLYALDHAGKIRQALREVITALVELAGEHTGTPFPGHTHLQQAQVLSLGHLLLAHAWSLKSDNEFLDRVKQVTSVCPLGSAALGGSTAPVDREWIASELGFAAPSDNSVEAVASRDFVMDLLYGLSRTGVHLSRLAEDFILWNSQEFGFVTLADTVATGSSLLAHKKNPDMFELIRGKSGRLVGNHTGFLATVKGLPSGYNKDLQEDKEPLFDSVDTVLQLLPALEVTLRGVTFNVERIAAQLSPYLKAERIVQYLTGRGVAFREAYGIAGSLVKEAESQAVALEDLPVKVFQKASPSFEEDILTVLESDWEIPAEGVMGGSNRKSVEQQLKQLRDWIKR
ncbi:MAG: argininosuccinate lyase [Fidelibacterota bacterium]|nr:MAG: argininosuccinate lyase [Candidatus Neomarinimicrobiota bacterium]